MAMFTETTGTSVRYTNTEDGEIVELGVALPGEGALAATFDEYEDGGPIEERTMTLKVRRAGMIDLSLSITLVDALWLATALQREINLEINQG